MDIFSCKRNEEIFYILLWSDIQDILIMLKSRVEKNIFFREKEKKNFFV